jgi:hypothetical protein
MNSEKNYIKINNTYIIANGILVSAIYGRKYEAIWHNGRIYGTKINNPENGFSGYNELEEYIDSLSIKIE